MRAPRKLYWVELNTVGKLSFRQKGGGKFTDLAAARDRQERLLRDGIESTVYESRLVWRPVEVAE